MKIDLIDLLESLDSELRQRDMFMGSEIVRNASETLTTQQEVIVSLAALINFYASEHERKWKELPADTPKEELQARLVKYRRNALVIDRVIDMCPWLDRTEFEEFDLEGYYQRIGLEKEEVDA